MTQLHVEPSDEREQQWERTNPRYCVYFYSPSATEEGSAPSYSVESFLVSGAAFLSVKSWAESHRGSRIVTIGVLADQDGSPGVIWLDGTDPNVS